MSADTAYMRHRMGAVRPYLYGGLDLIDFLVQVFEAEVLERLPVAKGFHVEARIGDSVLVLEAGEFPPSVQPTRASTYVYVKDVDAVYRRAIERGATSVGAPEDKPYKERAAGFKDSFGNTWYIATYRG